MSIFKEYGDAFENRFAHDEYLRFKATARRNRLLGEWAASVMGKTGIEVEDYAAQVVHADLESAGDHDVIAKLHRDLAACGKPVAEEELRRLSDVLMRQATQEIRLGLPGQGPHTNDNRQRRPSSAA